MIINPYRFAAAGGGGSPLLTNLISHWKLNEASGTRNDSHGTNHLTDNNTVGSAAGKLGNAGVFVNANAEYLSIADNSSFDLSNKMSASYWINRSNNSAELGVMGKWDYQTDGEWLIEVNALEVRIFIATSANDDGSGCIVQSTFALQNTGTWYHIVIVYDGTLSGNTNRLKIYQDGVQLAQGTTGSVPATLINGTANFYLGRFGGLGRYYDGLLDSVSLWSRAITAAEVTELYNAGAGLDYPF